MSAIGPTSPEKAPDLPPFVVGFLLSAVAVLPLALVTASGLFPGFYVRSSRLVALIGVSIAYNMYGWRKEMRQRKAQHASEDYDSAATAGFDRLKFDAFAVAYVAVSIAVLLLTGHPTATAMPGFATDYTFTSAAGIALLWTYSLYKLVLG